MYLVHAHVEDPPDYSLPQPKRLVPEKRSGVITYPIVVAPEMQTYNEYGAEAIEQRIQEAIQYTNQLYTNNGILMQFSFLRLDPAFDINQQTTCKGNSNPDKYYPVLYCSHDFSYIYVVIDDNATYGGSAARYSVASFRFVGNNLLFNDSYDKRGEFAHEVTHITGLPDLYIPRIAFSADNEVNGEKYFPFSGDLMASSSWDQFLPWSRETLARQSGTLPSDWYIVRDFQPQQNYLKFVDTNNCPVGGLEVNIYESRQDGAQSTIDTIAEVSGISDENGRINWGNNILNGYPWLLFLIEIKQNSAVQYFWEDFSSINFAYWNGFETEAEYVHTTVFAGDCSTPTLTPTPTGQASPTQTTSPPPTCPRKSEGDANCDDRITLLDFDRWRQEYLDELYGFNADFDSSKSVTLVDFEIWRLHRE